MLKKIESNVSVNHDSINELTFSKIVIITPCYYGYLGIRSILGKISTEALKIHDTIYEVMWFKNTIELDSRIFIGIDAPILIVCGYPETLKNNLFISTLSEYFRRIIFIERCEDGRSGSIFFINTNRTLDDLKQRLEDSMRNFKHDVIKKAQIHPDIINKLTQREICIAELLLQGVSIKDVCSRLNITVKTVYNYRVNICEKAGVKRIRDLLIR